MRLPISLIGWETLSVILAHSPSRYHQNYAFLCHYPENDNYVHYMVTNCLTHNPPFESSAYAPAMQCLQTLSLAKRLVKGLAVETSWASEASPTLGCSIEISHDI